MHFMEDLSFEEERVVVRNVGGGRIASTVRAWVNGMSFFTIVSGVSMFIFMRSPAVNLLSSYQVGVIYANLSLKYTMYRWILNTIHLRSKVITLMANQSIM